MLYLHLVSAVRPSRLALTTALPSSDTSKCRVVVFGLSSAATFTKTLVFGNIE